MYILALSTKIGVASHTMPGEEIWANPSFFMFSEWDPQLLVHRCERFPAWDEMRPM